MKDRPGPHFMVNLPCNTEALDSGTDFTASLLYSTEALGPDTDFTASLLYSTEALGPNTDFMVNLPYNTEALALILQPASHTLQKHWVLALTPVTSDYGLHYWVDAITKS